MKKMSMAALSVLAFLQTSSVSQPDIIWQPSLGKKKIKPRNKRGSNWKSSFYAECEKKSHSERNKKGKP